MICRPVPSRPAAGSSLAVVSVLVLLGLLAPTPAAGEDDGPTRGAHLRVAVVAAPPIVYADGDRWTGVGVDLVAELAARLGFDYELVPLPGEGAAVAALVAGEVDLAVGVDPPAGDAALAIGYPYYVSGHGVAVRSERGTGFRDLLRLFVSWELAKMVAALLAVIVVIGVGMWLIERRLENGSGFDERPHKGIATGIWWAVVTMTGVGYGDTLPRSAGGRAAAVTWMFVSLVLVAAFTATVTSQLTLSGFEQGIRRAEDLGRVSLAVVAESPSIGLLAARHVHADEVPTLEEGLRRLNEGKTQGLIHPRPALCRAVYRRGEQRAEVLPFELGRRDHVLLSRRGLVDDARWDLAVRNAVAADAWQDVLFRHLGC